MTELRKSFFTIRATVKEIVSGRALWACLLVLSMCTVMMYLTANVKTVYIRDEETTVLHYTLEDQLQGILSENDITTMVSDIVEFSGFNGKMGVISIDRAFPVNVMADGGTTEIMTTSVSVREFLENNEIYMGEDDLINLPTSFYLSEHDDIVINRVSGDIFVETQEIPFETVYKDTPLISIGATITTQRGGVGELQSEYADILVDGKLTERKLVQETVTEDPITQEVLRGARTPVSKLDFGIPLDANGIPVSYKEVLTNQIATGYSGSNTTYGASLMYLEAGYVAVRTDEIPYGTKMYITSADNRFVYGFAIAADTGIGLLDNAIDVDLYYDSFLESSLNGRKYVNIYILDDSQLTGSFKPSYRPGW